MGMPVIGATHPNDWEESDHKSWLWSRIDPIQNDPEIK